MIEQPPRREPPADAAAETGPAGAARATDRAPDPGPAESRQRPEGHGDRAERLQERLAIPVLVAALASVPAVFLTLFDDPARTVGSVLNGVSGAVLIAEAVVLLAVSEHRLRWVRENLWLVALAVLMIPAIVFAIGPVQLLRLLRLVGALRIIRVRRILRAGTILRNRAGLDQLWQRVIGVAVSLLVAGFVAVVLADPTSQSRQFIDEVVGVTGPVPVVIAGIVLAGATLVVYLNRGDETGENQRHDGESAGEPGTTSS